MMPYSYKVTLARKSDAGKNEKSLFSGILDRFAVAFRSSLNRVALRDLFIGCDASLIDTVPEIRLRRKSQPKTLFDMLWNHMDEPIELTFFEKDRLFPFLSWRRSFASALVFAITFAGFLGLSARDLQAASEQPHNAPQKHTVKGSIEFLPTDCPPVMQLSNCVNSVLTKTDRSMGMELMAQYPGVGHLNTPHSNGPHNNVPPYTTQSGEHSNTGPVDTHSNTSHVNLAPGDTIF